MRDKILYAIGLIAAAILLRDIYAISSLPPEASQGAIFKIIFFHVPMAISAMLCSFVAFTCSVLFLITRKFQFDAVAVAVTEVGLALLLGNLVTGSL